MTPSELEQTILQQSRELLNAGTCALALIPGQDEGAAGLPKLDIEIQFGEVVHVELDYKVERGFPGVFGSNALISSTDVRLTRVVNVRGLASGDMEEILKRLKNIASDTDGIRVEITMTLPRDFRW